MFEMSQLTFLLLATVVGFLFLVLLACLHRVIRLNSSWSARFSNARAATNLSKKIRPLIGPGVEILMPTGYGRYPLAIGEKARKEWEDTFEDWISLGARLTIIITSPNGPAYEYWAQFVQRLGENFNVCMLDRRLAAPEDAVEIERLDKFHPVLVFKGDHPLAMWVENFHPPDSRIAYNVEYVATKDIVDYQRARFDRFLRVLRRLTDCRSSPPYLRYLSHDKSNKPQAA